MMTHQRSWLLGLMAATLLAGWSHWLWLAKRVSDGSDEPWEIVAMLTMVILIGKDIHKLQLPNACTLAVTAILMVIANVVWGVIPPIIATALAVLALSWLFSHLLPKHRPRLPLLMLGLLALPLTASLNFYVGYPLRWLCAQAAALMLSALGVIVTPQGATLLWNGKSILIDAPCAGIAMLWLGLYLTALCAYFNPTSNIKFLINLILGIIVVVVANLVRNVLLFYKESGMVQLPHWTHEGIGLLMFGGIVWSIFKLTATGNNAGDYHASHKF